MSHHYSPMKVNQSRNRFQESPTKVVSLVKRNKLILQIRGKKHNLFQKNQIRKFPINRYIKFIYDCILTRTQANEPNVKRERLFDWSSWNKRHQELGVVGNKSIVNRYIVVYFITGKKFSFSKEFYYRTVYEVQLFYIKCWKTETMNATENHFWLNRKKDCL